jgi:hypothetical protein
MKGNTEFRARWAVPSGRGKSRSPTSLGGRYLLLAAAVIALCLLARPAPGLRFGPAPRFEELPVGRRGEPHGVSLHNSGWGPLRIREIRLTGEAPGDFVPLVSDCAPRTLAPGRACMVTLSFAPQETGRRKAQLWVLAEGMAFSPGPALAGSAFARDDFRVLPPRLEFGDQAVGSPSDWRPVEIRSIAARPLQIVGAQLAGAIAEDFELGSNTCSAALPVGGQCSLAVRFTPRVPGERDATLVLNDSTGDAPHEIGLTGRGTSPDLTLDPELVPFPGVPLGQRSKPAVVSIRSSGTSSAHIASIAPGGEAPGDFILSENSCESATLPPEAFCSVTILFQPTREGPRTATLTLSDDTLDGPHVIRLQGTGTNRPRPSAQILAKTFSFGRQAVGTPRALPIVVLSRGSVPLTIGQVEFSGGQAPEFRLKTDCSRRVLRLDDHCEVDVYFLPARPGRSDAQISIPHDALDAPHVVSVDGEGFVPEVGWCCAGGRLFEAEARICKENGGRYFPDQGTARRACTPSPPPHQPVPPETPTGLEPGVASEKESPSIACDGVTLSWSVTTAPGGYFIRLGKLPTRDAPGEAGPRELYANPVSTNQFRIPSALEAGTYQWTVASLGSRQERSAPAPFRYFRCSPRVHIPSRVRVLSPAALKGVPPAPPPIQ